MCKIFQPSATVEEIIAANSAGMTDAQKSEYWFNLNQTIFALLGKVDVPIVDLDAATWLSVAQGQYPTLTDAKIADANFFTTTLTGLQKILSLDWTNLVKYVADISDCDKYADRLDTHMCDYYGINSVVQVWGDTTSGYHGFNLAVIQDDANPTKPLIARLVEPQSDMIFVTEGPAGTYTPRSISRNRGILKITGGKV
jgi:hypothetical protein